MVIAGIPLFDREDQPFIPTWGCESRGASADDTDRRALHGPSGNPFAGRWRRPTRVEDAEMTASPGMHSLGNRRSSRS
jgi:hypothetical protein